MSLKKKKLKIENLKIESFTTEKLDEVKGGRIDTIDILTSDTSRYCCVQCDNV
jgi:hypothetical protein